MLRLKLYRMTVLADAPVVEIVKITNAHIVSPFRETLIGSESDNLPSGSGLEPRSNAGLHHFSPAPSGAFCLKAKRGPGLGNPSPLRANPGVALEGRGRKATPSYQFGERDAGSSVRLLTSPFDALRDNRLAIVI
jgi:hypothetical protein